MKLSSITKRYHWYSKVKFDKKIGFYYQYINGHRMYIRHPRHYAAENDYNWVSSEILYKYYDPQPGNTVVDFGLGYGAEALYAASRFDNIRYIGIEPQPVIYELACNTFSGLGVDYTVSPYVISDAVNIKFSSQFGYGAVGEDDNGCVEVPTLSWAQFKEKYSIDKIDLMKVNIEGAERSLLQHINAFQNIKRWIISCHDFRANHGHGEYFRTKSYVVNTLKGQGYAVKFFDFGINWADDYVYAEREDLHGC